MDDLAARFVTELDCRPDLLPAGGTMVVAVSGGPDSIALLHLCARLPESLAVTVRAAHFDHGVRTESAAEARTVAGWCEALGVPCVIGRAEPDVARTQAAMRTARYGFLAGVCDRHSAARLATAHQADDQVETILQRMLRGTDLRGLAGIPLRRGRIVRPLLPFRRQEILDWLSSHGIAHLSDPSNEDPRWTRTVVRRTILPELDAREPAVRRRLLRIATLAAEVERSLEELTEAVQQRAWRGILALPPSTGILLDRRELRRHGAELAGRVLRRASRGLGVELGRGGTRAAVEFISRGRSGGQVDLGGGLRLSREYDGLVLSRGGDSVAPDREVVISRPGSGGGVLRVGGQEYVAEWSLRQKSESVGASRIAVSAEGAHYPMRLRRWRPGDRIRLGTGSRKLKRLFGDRRIPRARRNRIPVLVDDDGEVLWITGLAVSANVGCRASPGPVLEVELRDV